jgi:hypothetical protein
MEKHGDVKIVDMGGSRMGGANGHATAPGADQRRRVAVNALLSYRLQSPVIDQVLREVGLTGSDPLKAMLSGLESKPAHAPTPAAAPVIHAPAPPSTPPQHD